MPHYHMSSNCAHALEQAQIKTDWLSVVEVFTPEVLKIVQTHLRSHYNVMDGTSTQQAAHAPNLAALFCAKLRACKRFLCSY